MMGVSAIKKDHIVGTIALLITTLIWGLSFINIKIAIRVVGPMTLGFLRFLIAFVLLYGIKHLKEPKRRLDKQDRKLMALSGLLGITLYFFFENNGVKMVSVGSAAIIVAAIPIANVLGEAIVYKKKVGLLTCIGAIVSILGVAMVTGVAPALNDNVLGYWYMFGAVLCWVVYCLVSKPLFSKYSSLTLTYYQTVYGTIFFTPFVFFENNQWASVDWVVWTHIFILGVFASAVGFYLYLMAMDKLGIALSSLYLNLIPIFTLFFGYLFMKDKVSWGQIWGVALVIVAVIVAGKDKGVVRDEN